MWYHRLAACAALLFCLSLVVGCESSKTTGQAQTHPQSKTEEIKKPDDKSETKTSE